MAPKNAASSSMLWCSKSAGLFGDALHGTVDGGLDALVAEVLVNRAGELRFRSGLGRRGLSAHAAQSCCPSHMAHRWPVARLVMLASTSMRSGALRSRGGLGSASSISESATGCVGRGLLVEGSSGEGEALPAAMRAATRHAPFLLRQLSHFSSFGASRGHFPSLAGAPLRFIGAKRPSLRGVTCPRPSSPRRAQPKCGETVGFNAFAHSGDRGQCPRHFALLK